MKSQPVSRANLVQLFESVVESRQPVRLTSHNASVVLVDEQQWLAIEETLLRLSAPTLSGAAIRKLNAPMQGGAHVRH